MILLAPAGLALLLVAALVLLLHMRRRRTIAVPSLAIWKRIQIGQQKRSRTLQWPPFSWPLLLQLVAVAIAAIAVAQPILTAAERVDHWIFVVDHSGAMRAPGASGDLLAEAKQDLVARLASAAGGERISVVTVGEAAAPLVARQDSDSPGIAGAISSIPPEEGRAARDASTGIVRSLMQPGERTVVVSYSDHAVKLDGLPEGTVAESVAYAPANRADASLSAKLVPASSAPSKWTLEGTVLMQGGMAGTELVVSYAAAGLGSSLEWTRETVGRPDAQATDAVSRDFDIDLELPGPGVVSVAVAPDGNPSGDKAWFVTRSEARPIRVLYIGAGEQPLLAALKAIDGIEIYEAAGLPADVSDFDLVAVDNRHISRVPETNVIWIGDAGVGDGTLPFEPAPLPSAALTAHPLMTGVDWADISAEQLFAPPSEPAQTLLGANGRPMITLTEGDTGRGVRLLFDLRRSNWPQQTSFPVFVSNFVNWLGLQAQGVVAPGCYVGEPCGLDARLMGGTITRLDVPGEPRKLTTTRFVPTTAGLYQVKNGDRSLLLAINPASPSPVSARDAGVTNAGDFPIALWPWLLGLLLVVLLAEAVVAGLGSERFLHLSALTEVSALKARRRAVLALRVVTLILVGFAVFNLHLPLPRWGAEVVRVHAPGTTNVKDAAIVAGPQPVIATTGPAPLRGGDVGQAIALAAASIPWGEPGRIVVEGRADLGEDAALRLGDTLLARSIAVETMPVVVTSATDVAVTAIETPSPIYEGDTFHLTGIVHANTDTAATMALLRDGQGLVERRVMLLAGDNRIDMLVSDIAGGAADYQLRVTAEGDTTPANDAFHRSIVARPPGKVAVVTADAAQGEAFAGWLATQGMTAEMLEPDKAPYKLENWRVYDGAVLLDVPAIALTTQQQEVLRSAVADEGLGLLILGGPNAFGPGGYLETPLDDLSPLSSKVPRDMPEATLVFVLDRSGSMQQPVGNETRLDVAKTATLSAVRLLNPRSQVGVIVFDSEPTTVFPLQKLDNPEAVGVALSTLDPGGGTSIYPGLKAAYDMLRGVDSPARHIVVMTDGLTQPGDFPGLLGDIRAAGITVSSVSIGKGAEREVVAEIAKLGNGTFHATDDFSALPSILSQEAMLLSGSPIEEHDAQPLWASRAEPFLRGLPATMPPIHGFVLTTPKPEASLSMAVSDSKGEAMPLLASWRYGNGAVLALTTDAAGPWSADWQNLGTYPAFWSQALRQFLPPIDRGDVVLNLAAKGDGVSATVTLAGTSIGATPTLVANVAGVTVPVPLQRVAADRFEGDFYPSAEGQLGFAATADDTTVTGNWFANYPAYLRGAAMDAGLEKLVAVTEGNTPDANSLRWIEHSAWPIWSIAALTLLMVELVVRYTSLIPAAPSSSRIGPLTAPRRRVPSALETVDA